VFGDRHARIVPEIIISKDIGAVRTHRGGLRAVNEGGPCTGSTGTSLLIPAILLSSGGNFFGTGQPQRIPLRWSQGVRTALF